MKSIKEIVSGLPQEPGIYQYFDASGKLLYVGKAKSLKKRVSSYFNKTHNSSRLRLLVKRIADIQVIVTPTELDALLLENSLIKKHQPRYNIQLKDDKTYPWIVIRNEPFPRVHATRNPVDDGSEYFGPYASVVAMRSLLELAKKLYPLRSCSYYLSKENIAKGKFRECLEYHIGNCMAPCTGKQLEEDYQAYIRQIKQIIRGSLGEVKRTFQEKISEYAGNLEFERAQMLKEKLDALDRYQAKTAVVSAKVKNADIISLVRDDRYAYINYMRVINGNLLHSYSMEARLQLDEKEQEVLEYALLEMRNRFRSDAAEVICGKSLELVPEGIIVTVPHRGEKRSLLELSQRNARFYMLEKHKREKVKNPDRHTERILNTLKQDLRLTQLPVHMECFDNSNIQGTNPVSACVVFRQAKPSRKEYRHFNIITVEGPDDFASMEEVVHRRYKRLLDDGEELPQLIVIDGGKGQLNAALKSLELLGLRGKIAVVGIAKRLEEIYFPDDPNPLYIDKRSESLKLLQHMRNEAHRFGITHHRARRSKQALQHALADLEGIGEKTSETLLKHFKSRKRVLDADEEDLIKLIGPAKAKKIIAFRQGESKP